MKLVKTVDEFRGDLRRHPDLAVSMQVQAAIDRLVESGGLENSDMLSTSVLGKIRMELYNAPSNTDPFEMLFQAMAGETGNPIEAALQYIENLLWN